MTTEDFMDEDFLKNKFKSVLQKNHIEGIEPNTINPDLPYIEQFKTLLKNKDLEKDHVQTIMNEFKDALIHSLKSKDIKDEFQTVLTKILENE